MEANRHLKVHFFSENSREKFIRASWLALRMRSLSLTFERMNIPSHVTIRHDLRPADVDAIIALHGVVYADEYGWDKTFREHVEGPLTEFAKAPTKRSKV